MQQIWWIFAPVAGYWLGGNSGFVVGLAFNVLVWILKLMYDELSTEKKQ